MLNENPVSHRTSKAILIIAGFGGGKGMLF